MDLGATITILILLFIGLVPVVVLNRMKRKREKQFSQSFFNLAVNSNCKISEYDFWNNTAIGVDKDVHKLFFRRATDNNELSEEINLTEILKCRIVNTNRSVSNKEINQIVIDKLELAFTFYDKDKSDTFWEFYSAGRDSFSLKGELQLTEKWLKIVNTELENITPKK